MHTILMIILAIMFIKLIIQSIWCLLEIIADIALWLFHKLLHIISYPLKWLGILWRIAFDK